MLPVLLVPKSDGMPDEGVKVQVLAADDHWSNITAHGVEADATQVVSQLPIFKEISCCLSHSCCEILYMKK